MGLYRGREEMGGSKINNRRPGNSKIDYLIVGSSFLEAKSGGE